MNVCNAFSTIAARPKAKIWRTLVLWLTVFAGLAGNSKALAATELSAFSKIPSVRSMSISPNGRYYAWLQQENDENLIVVYDTQNDATSVTRTGDKLKNRSINFATNEYVVLHASSTQRFYSRLNPLEYSGAFSFNLATGEVKRLLLGTQDLYLSQTGLGRIIGVNEDDASVFMPAWDNKSTPRYNLYKVSLETGRGVMIAPGSWRTTDWFVGAQGDVLAREDFDHEKNEYALYSYSDGKAEKIFTQKTHLPEISSQALSQDEKYLLLADTSQNLAQVLAVELSSGKQHQWPIANQQEDIDDLITDGNRKLIAVKFAGFQPSYQFTEEHLQSSIEEIQNIFPSSSPTLLSISANKTQFIIKISGNSEPEAYYLFDTQNRKLRWLTKGYSNLASEDLGEVIAFRYPARDGLKIPAVLTWPSDKKTAEQRKNLPLIVLPHGGPDAYDAIGFDWLAQFLANKGYLVLQPNFRGSTGFGGDFHRAGIGAWGREMQNDISDGVNYLTSKGIAARKRTCIVGASYGGYAALAGAALTPELYRCVIAINGISDVRQHINRSVRNNAEPERVRRQWEGVFGDDKNAFKRLDEVSAYFFADRFNAATLLIYSKDDSIVSPRQSTKMHKALKKAGVNSTLIGLKGEDHWLSTSEMRHQLLSALGSFLDEHNPAP